MTFQELLAAQIASGGQNVITPDNAGRILGLAAQQEANRQLSLAAGNQAVQEAINRQIASGERAAPDKEGKMDQYGQYVSPLQRSDQVVTAPSGVKFVTDAQGNVIGTNAPITPLGPKQYAGESMQEARQAFNRGESTQAERDAFRQNMFGNARSPGLMQKTFIQEMQKQAPAPAPAPDQPPAKGGFSEKDTQEIMQKIKSRPWEEALKKQTEQRLGVGVNFGYDLPSERQREMQAYSADLYRARQEAMARGASAEQLKPIEDAIRAQHEATKVVQKSDFDLSQPSEDLLNRTTTDMENLYAESGVSSKDQRGEDKQRASLYKELQSINKSLTEGTQALGGGGGEDLPYFQPLSPKTRTALSKRKSQIEEEIRKSNERSSGIAAKTAAPKAKLEEYRALLEALARAQQ